MDDLTSANKWNRKDDSADSTVKHIKSILLECGVNTNIVSKMNYDSLWYSNRVEIKNFPFIGTNGKGVTEEYALASAYGEFMERLQGGTLISGLFPNKKILNQSVIQENIRKVLDSGVIRDYFSTVVTDESKERDIVENLCEASLLESFYDLKTCKEIEIPIYLIKLLAGSNGLCAGNTYEEAFVQGMSEVFERFVLKKIYLGDYEEGTFAEVDTSVYKNLYSYQMIEAIEGKNYKVHIIDCTFNQKVPVLGVLVTNMSNDKYVFRMGADSNIDICIQRCITEIFQGLEFNQFFGAKMKDSLICEGDGDFWKQGNNCYEYMKSLIDGAGRLPRKFLNSLKYTAKRLKVFEKTAASSNFEAAKIMAKIAADLFEHVFITDYGTLGFPTMRIYIPDASDCFYYREANISALLKDKKLVRDSLRVGKLNSKEVLDAIIRITDYQAYQYSFSLSKLFGLQLNDYSGREYLLNPYLFITLLALHLGQSKIAIEYAGRERLYYEDNLKNNRLTKVLVEALAKNVSKNKFIHFITIYNPDSTFLRRVEQFYSIKENGINISCGDCILCDFRSNCQYDEYRTIINNIDKIAQDNKAGNEGYRVLLDMIGKQIV